MSLLCVDEITQDDWNVEPVFFYSVPCFYVGTVVLQSELSESCEFKFKPRLNSGFYIFNHVFTRIHIFNVNLTFTNRCNVERLAIWIIITVHCRGALSDITVNAINIGPSVMTDAK